MEETKMWANLNDSYNQEIIFIENQNLKKFIPKIENKIKLAQSKAVESLENIEYNVNNILELEYTNLNILELITRQLNVSSYLVKLFKSLTSENIKWELFNKYLVYLLQTSSYVVSKTNLDIKIFKLDTIYRSSYKFCNKADTCELLYGHLINNKKRNYCHCDHYVHNKLISDLNSLITFFNNNPDFIINNNLRTCLDTTFFVINHMFQELNSFNLYYSKDANFNINKYYITNKK